LSRHPTRLRIVSPFLGRIPGFGKLADFSRHILREEGRELQIVTLPPKEESNARISRIGAEALVNLGVDLQIRKNPPLHSKVYQFTYDDGSKESFLGSANFTKGGFERNDETVAYFTDKDGNRKVESERNRLSGSGAVPLNLWLIETRE
jgi:phosphatidylserine/phosphatidylglycerophosphate/cardiolipin synthase-like enzyme